MTLNQNVQLINASASTLTEAVASVNNQIAALQASAGADKTFDIQQPFAYFDGSKHNLIVSYKIIDYSNYLP